MLLHVTLEMRIFRFQETLFFRSKKVSDPAVEEKADKLVNLAPTLVNTTVGSLESGYSWGVAVQGFTKKRKTEKEDQSWLDQIREDIKLDLKFPLVNQPVSEVLCIVADVDNWQVGLLSSNAATHTSLAPVGMSTLVANMLEAFTFIWKEFESPEQVRKPLKIKISSNYKSQSWYERTISKV